MDDDDESVPGIFDCFHTPCSFPINAASSDLLPSQYDTVLQDDVNGELYCDDLEDIDSDLDKHSDCYVNVGDFPFSDDDPLSIF